MLCTQLKRVIATAVLTISLASMSSAHAESKLTLLRVPDGGIQPQCLVDAKGAWHLIYFKGDAGAGDVFYVRSDDEGKKFSKPLRVNSKPGSVIAVGNVRGAHLALGKNGRVHVAWMGSNKADPAGPDNKQSPLLYTRLNDDSTDFEPQRNVIQSAYGLDGGASVAADSAGNVYVVWHAPDPGKRGEDNRCVWVARSKDDGKIFAPEKRAFAESTGACGCCGMRAFADSQGRVYILYRAAKEGVHRDMYLIASAGPADSFLGAKIHEWNIDTCMMSTAAFGQAGDSVLGAWETEERIYWGRFDPALRKQVQEVAAPVRSKPAKHPAVTGNGRGEILLAWTEGMGWNRGGTLAWQLFDADGKPTGEKGRAEGVPVWSLVAVCARSDGGFTIIY
jgi:hypothetical protein